MAQRVVEPEAGDEVRFQHGRHARQGTFIRYSSRGAKAHVFADGRHRQIEAGRITHLRPLPARERARALEEPLRVADALRRNLSGHALGSAAEETHRAVSEERAHARALHAVIVLSYHGHEGHARHLLDRLDYGDPVEEVADEAEQRLGDADLRGDLEGEGEAAARARERTPEPGLHPPG